ncbi:MAG: lycopene beta-cyclase CrtY [Planctomycetota bacterium]
MQSQNQRSQDQFDFIIVGGGLQGCLATHAIAHYQPEASLLLVEKNQNLCGNHTWSFLETDVNPESLEWFEKLIDKTWSRHHVKLGGQTRHIQVGYRSIFSSSLARKTETLVESHENISICRDYATEVSNRSLRISTGQTMVGQAVLDCRGLANEFEKYLGCGFQKFVGFEIELTKDWLSDNPCLMDDDTDQSDGFRFVYALPFSRRRILLEDTCFSNDPSLIQQDCLATIDAYLCKKGYQDYRILGKESGCLPMPWSNSKLVKQNALGYRGEFFHPATGYSLPLAVNLAQKIAQQSPSLSVQAIHAFRKENRFQSVFSRLLNRMLFRLIEPKHRAGIFHRFYQVMPDDAICRFYGHRFSVRDVARLIVGRLPSGLTPIRFFRSFREKPCPVH